MGVSQLFLMKTHEIPGEFRLFLLNRSGEVLA